MSTRSSSASPSVPPSPAATGRSGLPRSFNSSQLRQPYAPSRLSSSASPASATAGSASESLSSSNHAHYRSGTSELSHPPSPLGASQSWLWPPPPLSASLSGSKNASPAPSIDPSPSSVAARERGRLVRHSSTLSSAPHTAHPSPYQPSLSYPISITSSSRPPTPSRRSSQAPAPAPFPLFPSRHTRESSVTNSIGNMSRPPSPRHRHASIVSFKSFVEGITHVTRVRSPVLRGHSRCTSRDDLASSYAAGGAESSTPSLMADSRQWELESGGRSEFGVAPDDFLRPGARRPSIASRTSSFNSQTGRPALLSAHRTPPGTFYDSSSASPREVLTSRANDESSSRGRARRKLSDRPTFETGLYEDEDEIMPDEEGDEPYSKHPDRWKEEVEEVHARGYTGFGEVDEADVDHLEAGDIQVFEEGDIVGVGMSHRGYEIKDCFADQPLANGTPKVDKGRAEKFEVIRQLGHGSYAVVYLVREILEDGDAAGFSDAPWGDDDDDSDLFSVGDYVRNSNTRGRREGSRVYGEEFALKCLCKRNLSEDLLEVQRFEATLHQSLPQHANIVALHQAFETSEWLFLVLEYCPGQDLFYWLEQSRDHEDLEASAVLAPRGATITTSTVLPRASDLNPGDATVTYRWPPPPMSPDRDVRGLDSPDNTPPSPSLLASTANDSLLSRRRLKLISRMFAQMCDAVQACHDVGISHRDIKPENFIVMDDRGKIGPGDKRVVVKITDWGLGTADTECEDWECGSRPYMAFECRNNLRPSYDPRQADVWSLGIVLINLLYHRCPWSDPTPYDPDFSAFRKAPVEFLQDRFEGIGVRVADFLAENVFCDVVEGDKQRVSAGQLGAWAKGLVRNLGDGERRASMSESTYPITPSSHRVVADPRMTQISTADRPSPRSSLTHSFSQLQVVASPSPLSRYTQLPEEAKALPEQPLRPRTTTELHEAIASDNEAASPTAEPERKSSRTERMRLSVNTEVNPHLRRRDRAEDEATDLVSEGDLDSAARVRRRKRGARKGKVTKHSQDAGTGTIADDGDARDHPNGRPRRSETDAHLKQMAEAAQSIARELSKAKTPSSCSPVTLPQINEPKDASAKRPSSKASFMGRMMSAFKDGNEDLNAFAAEARARDARLGYSETSSAPAKMQQRSLPGSAVTSANSFGTSSAGSWAGEDDRGRHWASAQSRRERVDRRRTTNKQAEASVPPPSSRLHAHHGGNSALSSPSVASPLSSFSSAASALDSPATSFGSAGPWTPKSATPMRSAGALHHPHNLLFGGPEADATPRPTKPGFGRLNEHDRPRPPHVRSSLSQSTTRSVYSRKDAGTSTTSLESVREPPFVVLASPPNPNAAAVGPTPPSTLGALQHTTSNIARKRDSATTTRAPPSRDGSIMDSAGGKKKLTGMLKSFKAFNRGKDRDADGEEVQ